MSIRRNVLANGAGRVWSSLMSFAFVPLYIRFLGMEAYGLIGFFISLLAVFFVFDMGFSTSITRELARVDVQVDARHHARDMVRTLELIYWATGISLGTALVLLAPWIAQHGLNSRQLPLPQVTASIRLMGLVAVFRWPVPLYSGGLMGLHRQVTLNVVTSVIATLQGGGAVLVLALIAPTIEAFFLWQLVVSALQIVLLRTLVWRALQVPSHSPSFSAPVLRSILGFSAGVSCITILSVVLTQFDKFLVGKYLPLEALGYYALAGSIAGVLNIAAMAVYSALFPAFSRAVAEGAADALRDMYHNSCQVLAAFLIPAGVTLALFSRELLTFYVSSPVIVDNTYRLLSLLAIGNMGLSLMLLPLALQLAHGWTTLSLYKNVVAVVLFVPVVYVMVSRYGAIGAASVWIVLTLGYVLIEIPLMHRRLLVGEMASWYLVDVGRPLLVALFVLLPVRLLLPVGAPLVVTIPTICVAAGLAVVAAAVSLPGLRYLSRGVLRRLQPVH